MSIRFANLGSGSSGNSTVVVLEGETHADAPTIVLIDAGLTPLATRRRLASFGITLDDLSAILVTHFDTDHFVPTWAGVVEKLELTVYAHHQHRRAAAAALGSVRRVCLFKDSFHLPNQQGGGFAAIAPHDEHGSACYRLEHRSASLGFATDLGRVTPTVHRLLKGVDALAMESNYDPELQKRSARPAVLKRRIMGGQGHLSNLESLDAVLEIASHATLQHVAALHLSQQCNDPALIASLYAHHAGDLLHRLTITHQTRPTMMLNIAARSNGDCRAGHAMHAYHALPGEQRVMF